MKHRIFLLLFLIFVLASFHHEENKSIDQKIIGTWLDFYMGVNSSQKLYIKLIRTDALNAYQWGYHFRGNGNFTGKRSKKGMWCGTGEKLRSYTGQWWIQNDSFLVRKHGKHLDTNKILSVNDSILILQYD